jgi:biotin carboxyl carrier protein
MSSTITASQAAPAVYRPLPDADAEAPTNDAPATTLAGSVAAGMSLLAAPTTGRFRGCVERGIVGPGTVVGMVTGGGGRADEVVVPVAAEVCGLLALDGQLVQAGQALAWVRRCEA